MTKLNVIGSDPIPYLRFGDGWSSIILPEVRLGPFRETGMIAILLTSCNMNQPNVFRPGTIYLCSAENMDEGVEVEVDGPYDKEAILEEEWLANSSFAEPAEVKRAFNTWKVNENLGGNPLHMWLLKEKK